MVFLSHSWFDKPVARRVVESLAMEQVPCWLDEQQIDYGQNLRSVIMDAISKSDVYLYLVSKAANGSDWVQDELKFALGLEFESQLRIVPVRLKDNKDPMPNLLSGRVFASLDTSHGGFPQLAHNLAEIEGHERIADDSRISATVRLEEHRIVHTLEQARGFGAECERHVLLIDGRYESLSDLYWEMSGVRFPPIDKQARESDEIADTVARAHSQCRKIIKESKAVCRRFFATDRANDNCTYLDAGHERILYEMLHLLQWNTTYLRHLRGDEAFDESSIKNRYLREPFDGPTCDIISGSKKLGSVKVPEYARSDTSRLFGLPDSPFASIFPWDVGTAVGHVLARRFMADSIRSTEMPDPKTITS